MKILYYNNKLTKIAAIGETWLQKLNVPIENIPKFTNFLNNEEIFEGKKSNAVVKNIISKNPSISFEELKELSKPYQIQRELPIELIDKVKRITQNKEERIWIIKLLKEKIILEEDLAKVSLNIRDFRQIQKNVPENEKKELKDFKTNSELWEYNEKYKPKVDIENEIKNEEGIEILDHYNFEGKEVYLLYLTTQEALNKIGGTADWCVLHGTTYNPHEYYCYVIDGEAKVLIHPQSSQIKDRGDQPLEEIEIIEAIRGSLPKHINYSSSGDFEVYESKIKFIDLRKDEFKEKSNDKNFIKGEINKNFSVIYFLPIEKRGFAFDLIDNISILKKEAFNFKTWESIIEYLKINNYNDKLNEVKEIFKDWVFKEIPLSLGKYKKNVPSNLDLDTLVYESERDGESRPFIISKKIELQIKNNVQEYEKNLNNGNIPEEFKNDPRIKEARLNGWIKEIEKYPFSYKDCPEEFKNDPRIKEVAFNGWIKWIEEYPLHYKYCPEELKNDPRIKEVAFNGWIKKIEKDPFHFKNCPKEFKNDPRIKEARLNGWIKLLEENHNYYERCPEELKNNPRIKEAHFNGWIKEIEEYPSYYKDCPEEFKNDPRIKKAAFNGWIRLIEKDPFKYKNCPEEFKNDPRILAVLPENMKPKQEEKEEKEEDKELEVQAKSKFSSYFIHNIIYKF